MEITAFPYRIGTYRPEYTKTKEAQAEWITARLPRARKFVVDGVDTWFTREGKDKLVLFVHVELELLYSMELYKMQVSATADLPATLKRRANYQGSVWRDKRIQGYHDDFAGTIFTRLLLSSTRNVVSDSVQSQDGEAFWYRRVLGALRTGLKVYGLDCEARGGTLVIESATPVIDMRQFDTYYSGDQDLSGSYKRLAIVRE